MLVCLEWNINGKQIRKAGQEMFIIAQMQDDKHLDRDFPSWHNKISSYFGKDQPVNNDMLPKMLFKYKYGQKRINQNPEFSLNLNLPSCSGSTAFLKKSIRNLVRYLCRSLVKGSKDSFHIDFILMWKLSWAPMEVISSLIKGI